MSTALGAVKGERTVERWGWAYRSGDLHWWADHASGQDRVAGAQNRQERFSTAVFESYQRSEKVLVSSIIEIYVQGVCTRQVKQVAEQLCGYRVSAPAR